MKTSFEVIVRRCVMLLAVFFLLAAAASPVPEQEGPRISVPDRRYQAGKVQQGTQVTHVFEVKNTGTRTLVIERVQPG